MDLQTQKDWWWRTGVINKVGGNIAKKEQEKPVTDGTVGENPGCYSNSDQWCGDSYRWFPEVTPHHQAAYCALQMYLKIYIIMIITKTHTWVDVKMSWWNKYYQGNSIFEYTLNIKHILVFSAKKKRKNTNLNAKKQLYLNEFDFPRLNIKNELKLLYANGRWQ